MGGSHVSTNDEQRTTSSCTVYTGRREDTTSYFSGKTDTYQRCRPGYPRAAIEWVLEGLPESPLVADVGCGTGISSRALAAAGARVIGVEPNDDMRNAARAIAQPAGEQVIEYRKGTGEATGLDASAVDCVVCAQAFHWFDAPRALHEFHRVLRPKGRLALLWNKRDESDPASKEYERIIARAMDLAEGSGRAVARFRQAPPLFPWFHTETVRRFDNPAEYSLEELIGRARSSSYWPETGPGCVELEGELEALHRRHQHEGILHIGQFTEVTMAGRVRGS